MLEFATKKRNNYKVIGLKLDAILKLMHNGVLTLNHFKFRERLNTLGLHNLNGMIKPLSLCWLTEVL
jgi:hypothetical protein